MSEKEKKEKIVFKTFRPEIKAVDKEEGIIDMLIPMSTDSIDRDGESINPRGWKKSLAAFKKRAILVSSHAYSDLRKQIGELIEIKVVPEGLFAKPKYYINQGNDEADWGFNLASKGMAAYSVGFIPVKWKDSDDEDKPKRTFTEQELLEISHVIVPSNRDATQALRSKSEDPIMNKVIDDVLEKDEFIEVEEADEEEDEEEKDEEDEKDTKESEEEPNKGSNLDEIPEIVKENGKIITQYKERWNKSLSKSFDVERSQEAPTTFEYNLFKQFLNCEVRNIFQNDYLVPSPLLGTYLAGFKIIFDKFELKDTRNFSYGGIEIPPIYNIIRLNSTKSDDFLIEGIRFYMADDKSLIVKFSPSWYGINVSIITSNKHRNWNKELLEEARKWVKGNNYLKGESFALNGEFLEKSEDSWESLITEFNIKDAIKKSTNSLEKKGTKLESRGLLFIGRPGTGKTKTGRIILNNVDSTFIWVSSKDFNRAMGTGALNLAFSLARDLSPTVLFIEDIDTWLSGNMIDLLKTELDGLKQNKGIITILTSNYPERLPDALLDRPGRFHHVLEFPLPKSEFRREMISNWAGDIDGKILDEIIEKTEDFSGAHIKELVDFANIIVDEEDIEIGEALLKSLDRIMAQRELILEIRKNKDNLELKNKDIELKAGAVLNAKNKSNLKNAQKLNQDATALVQSVLDSAEPAEGEERQIDEEETKDTAKDDTVITIVEDKKDDPLKDEEKDEAKDKKTFTVDEELIAKTVNKVMKYHLGITDK